MNEAQISKQHPIPQNFMDVEFKIVGDFTVRQFTYLCATGFPMYLLFQSPVQGFIKSVLLIILGLLGFLLVFVPIDDRGMDVWIVNFFKAVYANNRRVWRKTPFVPKSLSMDAIKLVQGEMITLAPTASRRKLENYLKGIKSEEADEFDFNFNQFKYSFIEPTIATETSIQPLVYEAQEPSFTSSITSVPQISSPENQVIKEELKEEIKVIEPAAVQEVVLRAPMLTPNTTTPKTSTPVFQMPKRVIPDFKKIIPVRIQNIVKPKAIVPMDIHENFRTSEVGIPGRKFVSFSKPEQELILPVRGERIINIAGNNQPEQSRKDISSITRELRTLVRDIKTEIPSQEENFSNQPVTSNVEVSPNFITGIVFDSENNSLSNATLVLLDENNNELKYSRTDNSGRFIFKGTDAGKCKIKILNQEIFGLNFDIINLNIERYPYPLIQILGKK
jgi:hypothetical protein